MASEISLDKEKIKKVLERNVERAEPVDDIRKQLESGKQLRVKLGIDPTSPQIHLGNAVIFWKLREFQKMGHQIVLIVGDFTARIGDPSDKSERRPVLTLEQIKQNLESYKEQIGKILDIEKVEFRFNSEWLEKLSSWELVQLSRLVTVGQMLARRNFRERFENEVEIGIDEFLYPLFQGYDSYAIESDIELGGSDQLFNLQVGRRIQEAMNQDPQSYLITEMLPGTDGEKMSKSRGNVVNITDEPYQMFGKLMAVHDDHLDEYLRLATRLEQEKINERISNLEHGTNPKEIKKTLAFRVVELYHGEDQAQAARAEWENVFEKGAVPTVNTREVKLPVGTYTAADLLVRSGLSGSKSDAKRIIQQGGLKAGEEKVENWDAEFEVSEEPLLLQKGKKDFIKISAQ